jgi:tetratricopeptide (TPR) repeat protein
MLILQKLTRSVGATTPCDVTYATPREVVLSPAGGVPNPSGNAQSAWSRPPSTKSAQHIRLVWNGFKRTDFQQQYRDGLQDEQSGRTDDAEVKFRTALEGFHHLLSTTHHETLEAAHRLAAFYAQYSRMREAELILDWLIEAHVEDYGPSHEKTINQLLSVVQFYQDWHQPDEAAALLERLHLDREKRQHCKEDHDRTVEQTDRQVATPEEIPPNTDEAPALSITSTVVESVVESDVSIPSDRAIDPASINAYLRNVQNTPESDDHAVEIMNELLKHCNEFSKQLLCHSLLIHAALIAHHDRFMDVSRRDEATDEAEKAVNYLLHSDQPKTEVLFNVCLRLTEQFVKVGKYDTANDIFGHIEADAQQTFGFAHLRTIAMLKRIGKFYQDEGRWQDAAPRFEHALAASLSRYNPRDRSVKRLEAALEAQHYETDSSSKYDDVDYDSDSPGRKGRGRDVLRLDFRGTRPWIDR